MDVVAQILVLGIIIVINIKNQHTRQMTISQEGAEHLALAIEGGMIDEIEAKIKIGADRVQETNTNFVELAEKLKAAAS